MEIKGIDVSSYQGMIDWEQVASAGYKMRFCVVLPEVEQTINLSAIIHRQKMQG